MTNFERIKEMNVDVIRCKDCRHFIVDTFKRPMCNRTFTMFEMKPNDFCSYAEIKKIGGKK